MKMRTMRIITAAATRAANDSMDSHMRAMPTNHGINVVATDHRTEALCQRYPSKPRCTRQFRLM